MGGPCYAGNYHEARMAKALPKLYAPTFTEVRLAPGRTAEAASWSDLAGKPRPGKPWLDGMPRMIFVADMGDLFSMGIPFEYIKSEVFDVARSAKGRRHVWMLLTKQPRRMAKFALWLDTQGLEWPDNVWAGTSITGQATASRADHLGAVPAKVRFLSVEPQLGEIDGRRLFARRPIPCPDGLPGCCVMHFGPPPFRFVIQGGESDQGGHPARLFELRWARDLRDLCRESGMPYFLKQVGANPFDRGLPLKLRDSHGGDWSEWPEDIRVRQFPASTPIPAEANP